MTFPVQLEKRTEVYAINETLSLHSFVRRAIPPRYLAENEVGISFVAYISVPFFS